MSQWLLLSTIKRKLTLIIMLTCSVAMIVACAAILVSNTPGPADAETQHRGHGNVIGANVRPPSASRQEGRQGNLGALRAEPYVLSACLYNRDGEVFATYYREGQRRPPRRRSM